MMTEMIRLPLARGVSLDRSFYVNTTHKAAHWIRKPHKGQVSVKMSKVLLLGGGGGTIMHAPG